MTRFGLGVPTATEGMMYPVPYVDVDQAVELAVTAERLGFDSVWGNDHQTTQAYVRADFADPPSFFDPWLYLANVAALTTRIRLATCVTVLSFRHPVVLAKQAATLDRLSHGRLTLGVGIGAYREEFEALWPGRRLNRGEHAAEALAALRRLFTERRCSYDGRWVSFADVESYPKPVQDPLPLLSGGNAPGSRRRAATLADGWLPACLTPDEVAVGVADIRRKYDDYSLRTVPESETKSTWDLALVRMGFTVSASDLVFGYTLGLFFSFTQALLVALVYSVIISVVSVLMGVIGVRERTSFALTSRFAFGRQGSRLPSLVMAVIIAAFYGYILGITVDVFPKAGTAGQIGYSVGLGVLFLVISGLGFERGLKWIGRFGVPLMILLVVVADIGTVLHTGGFGAIVSAQPQQAGQMTLAAIIGLGVAKWLAGATVTPDLLRFARRPSAAVTTTVAEFLVGNFGFNLLGLILGLGLGRSDLGSAFALLGITWLATLAFVVQSITVEMNELYAASLATSNAVGLRRTVTNVIVGVIGIAIGYYGISQGIIASFLTFIGYVGYAIPAIPAIILADYFIVQRMHYPAGFAGLPASHGPGHAPMTTFSR